MHEFDMNWTTDDGGVDSTDGYLKTEQLRALIVIAQAFLADNKEN